MKTYFQLYDVANDYSLSPVPGKYQFGDLAHAKKAAQTSVYKMGSGPAYRIKWRRNPVSGSRDVKMEWIGSIHDGETVYRIIERTKNSVKTNPRKLQTKQKQKKLSEGDLIKYYNGRAFDRPKTKAMHEFLRREAPWRVVGLSIETDGVFIYTNSDEWQDDAGAGTFREDSETEAIKSFYERVQPGPNVNESLNYSGNPKRRKTVTRKNPERITESWLKKRVGLLNDMLDRPTTAYTKKADGGLTGNAGHLFIDNAYGGVKVAEMAGRGTGENDISNGYVPKRELNHFINGMIAGVREAQAGRKQNPTHKKTPGYSAGFKLGKGNRVMAKKKRSAKQLANDKRLGRMAKARAKVKRGGARKKVARKKVARKMNPKRTVSAKSHLWIVFSVVGNNAVSFAALNPNGLIVWRSDKAKAILRKRKSDAVAMAKFLSKKHKMRAIGVASESQTVSQIRNACSGK